MPADDYRDIVKDFCCPRLVISGPGSGKTHLLGDRVKGLLQNGVQHAEITVLAFGVDAKNHMRDALLDPGGDFGLTADQLPTVSTMHALGFDIVKQRATDVNLRSGTLKVLSDETVRRLLYRDASLILGYAERDARDAIECKQAGECSFREQSNRCKICRKYREIASKCNFIDYDDQILLACDILEKRPDTLSERQARTKHLLIDEYQDINAAQFRLIKLLSPPPHAGLLVVGDDAQSIYGFRGCDTKFILHFGQDFAGSRTSALAHSRRCPKPIMQDGFKVLERHYSAWSGHRDLAYHVEGGEPPHISCLPSELAEAEYIARIARWAIPKKDVLILAPKKELFGLISKKLTDLGVPHESPPEMLPDRLGTAARFMDWLRNPKGNFNTRFVVEILINKGIAKVPGANKRGRCLPETIANRVKAETEIARLWESVTPRKSLYSVVRAQGKHSPLLAQLRDGLWALEEAYGNWEALDRGEFAKRLWAVSGIWADPAKFGQDLTKLKNLLGPHRPSGPGSVQLKTLRKAKGLEADIVIVAGLEDDLVPGPKADVSEEARLFYVAMTRAREKLFLLHSIRRPRNISYGNKLLKKPRSRFLDAIGRASQWVRRRQSTST